VSFFLLFNLENLLQADQVLQNAESNTGSLRDRLQLGKWPALVSRWVAQDYIKLQKGETAESLITNNAIPFGSRFDAEFGNNLLLRMVKELRFDKWYKEEAEEQEDGKEKRESEVVARSARRSLRPTIEDEV
jgi:hypothetical protein